MKNIVIFASGSGSNALNIIKYFNNGDKARVLAVFCNRKEAGVIQKAQDENVAVYNFNRNDFYQDGKVIKDVSNLNPDIIVLAGFLWLVPGDFIRAFEGRIINLHPALLPKYGGKGMYGRNVHEAVLAAGEKETGITIHMVDEEYDKGDILSQESFEINPDDTVEKIEEKIHYLEHRFLPLVIEKFLSQ